MIDPILALALILFASGVPGHGHATPYALLVENLSSGASEEDQRTAVVDLIRRTIQDRSREFSVTINRNLGIANRGLDVVQLGTLADGNISIEASSGVAAAWGFNHYLKHSCHCHISWDHKQLSLPLKLPAVEATLNARDAVRYYQNVCAYGYSYVWWKWADFEKHIDWMAMSGFNLVLTSSGQEFIWSKMFQRFGMTENETLRYFTGPAFLPWNRMGNLHSWAGPLPRSWIEEDRRLQHLILQRVRSLGMIPVVPAFNGIVPERIVELYPNVSYTQLSSWGHFSIKYSDPYLVSVTSNLMRKLAIVFLDLYAKEYGTDHFYNLDTFNEISPQEFSLEYLKQYGRTMISTLKLVDPKSIWVLQGWMFKNESLWKVQEAKALLKSIPIGRVLVLDLAATTSPQYKRLDSFFGQPFVYCMLHNYGGTLGLYGKKETVNRGPYLARNFSSMVGTGITPEGIHNSYVMYELMLESSWRREPINNLDKWFQAYILRRYGSSVGKQLGVIQAWHHLSRSAYNCCHENESLQKEFRFHGKTIMTELPNLNLRQNIWYDQEEILFAWDGMMSNVSTQKEDDSNCRNAFIFDLIDVSRQAMTNWLFNPYKRALQAYFNKDLVELRQLAKQFLELMTDIDTLLGSCEGFLLGEWVENAKSRATNIYEKDLYEYNARNQITLWGPGGNILDYACKQWSGLVANYYRPRWKLFYIQLLKSIKQKQSWSQPRFRSIFVKRIGIPFTFGSETYPSNATGNPLQLASDMYKKWRKIF